jgi:hypothetical protein
MHARKFYYFLLPISILLLVGITLLWPTPPAEAQCGSQASSCKSCHEVQGELPVNSDGTDWHESHAFGDFCEFCHAGNVQATEEADAHVGMVPPLSDVEAGCASCHPDDLMEKAEVYAVALGVSIGDDGDTPAADGEPAMDDAPATETDAPTSDAPAASNNTAMESSESTGLAPTDLVINDPNTIDYVARYDEVVLGITPKNWGNIAIVGLIAIVIVAGFVFIIKNERWFGSEEETAVVGTYPTDAVAMLPQIAEMNNDGRSALSRLLEKPKEAARLFQSISKLNE